MKNLPIGTPILASSWAPSGGTFYAPSPRGSLLSTSFQKLFVEPINILAFLTLLFIISPKLTAIAILVIPISGAIIFGIARSIRRRAARSQAKLAGITSIIAETLSSIRIVKAFVMKNYELRRFYAQTKKYYELMLKKEPTNTQ